MLCASTSAGSVMVEIYREKQNFNLHLATTIIDNYTGYCYSKARNKACGNSYIMETACVHSEHNIIGLLFHVAFSIATVTVK